MSPLLLPLLLLSGTLSALVAAQDPESADSVSIYDESDLYSYHGCYNETTGINGSTHSRALEGGITEVREGEMTVPICLSFCSEGETEYEFAGLQWSRECWCAQRLSEMAEKLGDEQCSFPCEGDTSTACGGSLKLTVYQLREGASEKRTSNLVLLLLGLGLTVVL